MPSAAAQPPRALTNSLHQQHPPEEEGPRRQLGYVVVTRPVRQGRLRLALEEVLSMEVGLLVVLQGWERSSYSLVNYIFLF